MNWLDELDAILNRTSSQELERRWAKYEAFEVGPELESFVRSSMEFCYGQFLNDAQSVICQDSSKDYSFENTEFALAA